MSDGVAIGLARQQFFSDLGVPLANGTLTTYVANSTTLTSTWQDRQLTTLNTNPIALDAAGRCAVWLDPSISYKFVLKNSVGVIVWTQDNIPGSQLEATLASAATVNIGASSPFVYITGTTGITSFGTSYTGQRVLRFSGSLLLTHNPTTLILPGGVNITTQIGDTCVVAPIGSPASGWRVLSYQRGNDISWVLAPASGIFSYLATNSGTRVSAGSNGIGAFGAARTSVTGGSASDAAIAVAGFAYNDYPAGAAGAWSHYGTAVRASGVLGATHGMELDIANWGGTVPLFPSSMFPAGQTQALWLASGGESAATPGLCGVASAAIGIISNDSAHAAKFEKGIVFHNYAIAGADGTGGTNVGCAIAFAAGHQMVWFNNSTQACAEVTATSTSITGAVRLDFNDFGFLVQDRNTGKSRFLIDRKGTAVNYLAIGPGDTGVDPLLEARGDDAVMNLILKAKSTGYVGTPNAFKIGKDTAIPAGGLTAGGMLFFTAAKFGVFAGSGAPTLAADKGSLYLRSDGSGVGDRAFINTDGATTWTALSTAA